MPRFQVFEQKGINIQKTSRDGAEHGEGEAEAHGTGGHTTRCHHPVPTGDWASGQGRKGGGEGVMMMEEDRGRKGPLDRTNLGPKGTCLRRSRTENGRQTDKGIQTQDRARNSLGFPTGEESVDER